MPTVPNGAAFKEQGFLWERTLRSFLREFRVTVRSLPLPFTGVASFGETAHGVASPRTTDAR
jgi:hypothetical protein